MSTVQPSLARSLAPSRSVADSALADSYQIIFHEREISRILYAIFQIHTRCNVSEPTVYEAYMYGHSHALQILSKISCVSLLVYAARVGCARPQRPRPHCLVPTLRCSVVHYKFKFLNFPAKCFVSALSFPISPFSHRQH